MTRSLAALALVLCAVAPAAAAERNYTVTDFDRVVVDGPFLVRLVPGRTSTARAIGSQRALEAVRVDSQGRQLRIRHGGSGFANSPAAPAAPISIELSTRNLRSARLVGPGRLEIEGARGMELEFVVVGPGLLRASGIAADKVVLGLTGSGRLEVAGNAEMVTATVQGTGDLDAGSLLAEHVTLRATNLGTVRAAASETATVDAAGVGTVEVIGRPDCTVRGVAAGLVRCGRSEQR